jgi:DNA-binding transcriptional LysR family regulator
MIKRAHIQQFLAIVETGSFTQAAQRIRVTQPTLSVGIADLERLVGHRLFERSRRHVRLTHAGARFLPIARDLQKGFRAADTFGQASEKPWPQLRLGVLRTLATPVLQRIVEIIAAEVTLEVVEGTDSDLRMAMSDGRLDMMIGLLRPDETGPNTTLADW